MSLSLYKKKRRFNETPEPTGKEKSSKGYLRFVVQKHDASHLHYDFRLEMGGVLKSWAVPKGPSMDPSDKRLAMMVEDHPFDYRNFEGVIPEGNYGAGTVIVWDEGTYVPVGGEDLNRKEQEKLLLKQLHSGNLKFILYGKKLKGEFALFRLKKDDDGKSWILVKKNDQYATDEIITQKDKSVKSGKTLAQIAKANGTDVKHPEEVAGKRSRVKSITDSKNKPALAKKSSTKLSKKAEGKTTEKSARSVAAIRSAPAKKKVPEVKKLLGDSLKLARKAPMPQHVVPMLATLVDEPFDDPSWIYEIKWDGYRAVAYCEGESVELVSRNLKPFTERYGPVREALEGLELKAVFDGEVVAVNEKGLANFQMLQNWQNTNSKLAFFIFDIIWLDGYDITGLPLVERKRILSEVLPEDHPVIRYSDHVEGNGKDFFKAALKQGLEGVMAKKADSPYLMNERSPDWVKIKVNMRQEVIIAGYTQPRNTRKYFGSLLLGVYVGDELKYIGHTGSGFNKKSLEEIYKQLQPLVTDKCPFKECPKGNMPVTWVKPKLVCEIKFTEWTKDWMARHPIFMGLRLDKKPKDVVIEKTMNMALLKEKSSKQVKKKKVKALSKAAGYKPQAPGSELNKSGKGKTAGKKTAPAKKAVAKKSTLKNATAKKASPGKSTEKKAAEKKQAVKNATSKHKALPVLDLKAANDQEIDLNGKKLQLTNLNKLYWKKEKFTKGDMINYYLRISPYLMPYMMDRPQSLNRHPNGIDGPNFYQKDVRGKVPEWMKTFEEFSESTNETIEYLVCSNEATLIYMANLGCIEMHPWHSRTSSPLNPDWCLIDLDPDSPNTFEQVIDTAHVVKKVLDAIGAECCVKTSGSSGIHIYIPLGAKYDYDQSKQLAQLTVTMVNQELPDLTSLERSPAKRKGRIYLDYLQNRETQTAAAPYSLRPKPGVPVSTPLDWSEVKKGLTPVTYNAHNIFERLRSEGDLFKPVLGKGIQMEKVLKKLESLMK
jgi:bifunctional non-homologous end joining protein LigD